MRSTGRRMRWCTWCVAWMFVACGASGLAAQTASDALAGLRNAWIQALQQHDLEGSVALYEPDAVFLSGDGNRFPDRAAIRTLYRSVFALYAAKITMTNEKQDCSGVLCSDTGTFNETITEVATGKHLTTMGSYVLVARRQPDQTWKIVELAWTGAAPTLVK